MANARPIFRLVVANPEKFGEREIGQRRIAGELNDVRQAKRLFEIFALFFGPLVAPDDGVPDDVSRFIKHYSAVHLARKADARNFIGLCV